MTWKPVPEFPGVEASEGGDIRRFGKTLQQFTRVRNYLGVFFDGKRRLVHRVVASAFHGPSPFAGAEVLHLDNNPRNNSPSNLRWGTHAENMAMDHGNDHAHKGEKNKNAKVDISAVIEIRSAYDQRKGSHWGRKGLAEKFRLSEMQVYRIAQRKQGGWS